MNIAKAVIVGRSNVGKSSLFNKIIEQRRALVLPEAGTTRDVLEAEVHWRAQQFILVDTGGLDPLKTDTYHDSIISHAISAMKKADIILFLVDVTVGLIDEDRRISRELRKSGKKILLVVNKCDNERRRIYAKEFVSLGFEQYSISSTNGSGIGDLLDAILKALPNSLEKSIASEITLALIGKPNVGKSSILNSIAGEERMIVSEKPHTTRDSQDISISYKDTQYTVIDTAGIRRKTDKNDEIEELSINKSISAIDRSDVVALIVDISKEMTSQDKRLAREIEDKAKGLFVVANKWDLIPEKDEATLNKYTNYINANFPNLAWAPIVFTSAKDNKRIKEILVLAKDISQNLKREITLNALDKFLKSCIKKRKPTIGKGTRRPRLLLLKQVRSNPPVFVLEIPNKTNLGISYQQFLTNSLREKFDFEGVPLTLVVKERELKKDEMNISPPKRKRLTHRHRRI
ncbi:MAG: ribosome biogenesis GTPase Der [Parcubacteria group bacterium CG_4_10_14_0_2_um_filter_41_6]|nr:MAG: ribosome biogenesis GTPase Der [Parcubacteria group bacterium CG_4_10_14_0_2_um_filter_41_6]